MPGASSVTLYFSNHHRAKSFASNFLCTSEAVPRIALAFRSRCCRLFMTYDEHQGQQYGKLDIGAVHGASSRHQACGFVIGCQAWASMDWYTGLLRKFVYCVLMGIVSEMLYATMALTIRMMSSRVM